ncbi:MAG: hypothetical protein ABW321_02390, partial [Polyangiales bacterium]
LAHAFERGDEAAFFAKYPYDISPVYDDRPYFYQYYKPSRLFAAWQENSALEGAPQHGYWPYVILGAVFVQGVVLVLLFVFAPLLRWRRDGLRVPQASRLALYFAALGAGYIMIELALMQKLALLLGDPIFSITIVLGSMLASTGLGSFLSERWSRSPRAALQLLLAFVMVILLGLRLGLDPLVHACLGAPFLVRALVAVAICGVICVCLGQFFPLGLREIDDGARGFLPWAWSINGGFSVLGSIVTIVLAMAYGFSVVLALAAVVYAIGTLALLRRRVG